MSYQPFDIVLMLFPFTEKKGAKQRPALVLSDDRFNETHGHSIVAMITTASVTRWPSDLAIRDYGTAGLLNPCVIRAKLFTVADEIVIGKVGRLGIADQQATERWGRQLLATAG